jgi:O-acetyl-ADP-ribose deacetylase (regulator of RNase III)/uncharacterized protein YwgA
MNQKIKILIGDILKSGSQTLINTVNCVGIMGKGIALEFKNRFPDMFKEYEQKCQRKEIKPGIPYLYSVLFPPQIVNFPTKDHWKSVSRIEDIEKGLKILLNNYRKWGVTSLAIPPLGCGNGQLEWRAVGPLIYKYATRMDIPIELYAPYGTPPKELTPEFLSREPGDNSNHQGAIWQSSLNPAWIALVEIVKRIEEQPYHYPIGRTSFQKIAYVATREGLPTGFNYHRGSFGPFCDELKIAQTKLVNNNLIQEEHLGRMFRVKVGPNYQRVFQNYENSIRRWSPIIEKTTDLFMRINTDQAEITATVLFTADELKRKKKTKPDEMELMNAVLEWKQRRRPPLEQSSVASAIRNLGMLRWLDVKPDLNLPVPEEELVLI